MLVGVAAESWSSSALPDVMQPPCGQDFRVCDPERYMSDTAAVAKALKALERDYEYPGCGGYEMAVVIVGHIAGGGDASSTATFARSVMDSWGVGKPACNNGILLAMAIEDRQMFIATGHGARKYIANDELQHVIDRLKPLVRQTDYAGAVEQCISDIARILSGESFVPSSLPMVLGFVAMAFFVVWVGCQSRRRHRAYDECKRKLMQIEKQRSEAKASQYQQNACAICLELFTDTPTHENELLICGHKFHKACIASWEDRSGTCPICRQSTTEAIPASGNSGTAFARRPSTPESFYDQEYHFRLSQAHRLYPRYVTNEMVGRWSQPDYCGQLVADTSFIRNSPSYQASSGSSSSSSSGFSGGCSSGGGGAGGGW